MYDFKISPNREACLTVFIDRLFGVSCKSFADIDNVLKILILHIKEMETWEELATGSQSMHTKISIGDAHINQCRRVPHELNQNQ